MYMRRTGGAGMEYWVRFFRVRTDCGWPIIAADRAMGAGSGGDASGHYEAPSRWSEPADLDAPGGHLNIPIDHWKLTQKLCAGPIDSEVVLLTTADEAVAYAKARLGPLKEPENPPPIPLIARPPIISGGPAPVAAAPPTFSFPTLPTARWRLVARGDRRSLYVDVDSIVGPKAGNRKLNLFAVYAYSPAEDSTAVLVEATLDCSAWRLSLGNARVWFGVGGEPNSYDDAIGPFPTGQGGALGAAADAVCRDGLPESAFRTLDEAYADGGGN